MAKIIDPDLLTYIVDGSPAGENVQFNTTTKKIKLVAGGSLVAADGVTGQCLFTKIKQVLRASSILIGKPVPVREMIHDESMELVNDWQFEDATSLKMVRDCGIAYVHTNGTITAMFACFVSLGLLVAGTVAADIPYTLSSATNATTATFTHIHTGTTFGVNELVQIYSDPNADGSTADGYDYRAYAKLFLRRQGYTFDEASNSDIGYPSLTYKKYNFPLTHQVDTNVTEDDVTVAAYTGMSITWYAVAQSASLGANGPYDYHVIINANGHTHQEVYSWVQWKLRQTTDIDAGAGDRTGLVTPALVFMDGELLKTKYQAGVGGVHISNVAASSYNFVSEADDTQAYRTYPYTAALTCEFDSYLVNDTGPAKFWVFTAASYGGATPTLVEDASAVDIAGNVTSASMAFSYAWAEDTAVIGIAIGTDGAKIAVASTTLERSTANKLVFVAGQERWWNDPA